MFHIYLMPFNVSPKSWCKKAITLELKIWKKNFHIQGLVLKREGFTANDCNTTQRNQGPCQIYSTLQFSFFRSSCFLSFPDNLHIFCFSFRAMASSSSQTMKEVDSQMVKEMEEKLIKELGEVDDLLNRNSKLFCQLQSALVSFYFTSWNTYLF